MTRMVNARPEADLFLVEQAYSQQARGTPLRSDGLLSSEGPSYPTRESAFRERRDSEANGSVPLAPWLIDVIPKLRRLLDYGHNWDSYASPPPSIELAWQILPLLQETAKYYPNYRDVPTPDVVPVPGGGVQLEWFTPTRELEVEFGHAGKATFLAVDLRTGTELEQTFRTDDGGVMAALLAWVTGGN